METKKGRIIMVGDKNQAIYGFRGASIDAVNILVERTKAQELPLSISYRCAKAIIAEAQEIVPSIEAHENAEIGEVRNINIDEMQAQSGDFILCRTCAPLIKVCFGLLKQGIKASIVGRDIAEGLIALVENTAKSIKSQDLALIANELATNKATQCEKLIASKKCTLAILHGDKIDCVLLFIESTKSYDELLCKINEVFAESRGVGVLLMTVHKSKGLEADNVYILKPELFPHPMASNEWQIKQEYNLKYVAITRAKKNLFWVNMPKEMT